LTEPSPRELGGTEDEAHGRRRRALSTTAALRRRGSSATWRPPRPVPRMYRECGGLDASEARRERLLLIFGVCSLGRPKGTSVDSDGCVHRRRHHPAHTVVNKLACPTDERESSGDLFTLALALGPSNCRSCQQTGFVCALAPVVGTAWRTVSRERPRGELRGPWRLEGAESALG